MASPKKPATRGAKGNRRRTVLRRGGIGLLALALAGGGTWLGLQAAAAQKAADRYTTGTATTGSVTQTLSASGTVAKVNQASVSFPASGTVTSVKVSVGDAVTAGQELATIDTTALTAAVIQAKADLASARAGSGRRRGCRLSLGQRIRELRVLDHQRYVVAAVRNNQRLPQ